MADSSGAVDLGSLSPEEQDAVDQTVGPDPAVTTGASPEGSYPGDQNPEDNKRKVLTAFLVLVNYDGNPEVMAFQDENLLVQVQPTPDLISAFCSVVIKDLAAMETAQAAASGVVHLMQQQARAIAEQQAAQAIQQNLGPIRG